MRSRLHKILSSAQSPFRESKDEIKEEESHLPSNQNSLAGLSERNNDITTVLIKSGGIVSHNKISPHSSKRDLKEYIDAHKNNRFCASWHEKHLRSDQRQREMSPFAETDYDKTLKLISREAVSV